MEIVEVKSRATNFGGCELATREAQGYVDVLKPLGPRIVSMSAQLATVGGLRIERRRQDFGGGRARHADGGGRSARSGHLERLEGVQRPAEPAWHHLHHGVYRFQRRSCSRAVRRATPTPPAAGARRMQDAQRAAWDQGASAGFQVNGEGGVSSAARTPNAATRRNRRRSARSTTGPAPGPAPGPAASAPRAYSGRRRHAGRGSARVPDEQPSTVPILVGVGGAGALTATAIALARRRAQRIAEERLAKEAAERAAQRAAEIAPPSAPRLATPSSGLPSARAAQRGRRARRGKGRRRSGGAHRRAGGGQGRRQGLPARRGCRRGNRSIERRSRGPGRLRSERLRGALWHHDPQGHAAVAGNEGADRRRSGAAGNSPNRRPTAAIRPRCRKRRRGE